MDLQCSPPGKSENNQHLFSENPISKNPVKEQVQATLDLPEVHRNKFPTKSLNPYKDEVTRGWYQIIFYVPAVIKEKKSLYHKDFTIEVHNEDKRIYLEKLDAFPEPENNRTKITTIVKVIDNQFLWSALIYGIMGIGGIVAGTFLVDKVDELVNSSNQFFQESTKDILILIGSVATIALAWRSLK